MPASAFTYPEVGSKVAAVKEADIEEGFIRTLVSLKYTHRPDIRDRDALEANFREKFQRLNAVTLSDSEFAACWTRSLPQTFINPPRLSARSTPLSGTMASS